MLLTIEKTILFLILSKIALALIKYSEAIASFNIICLKAVLQIYLIRFNDKNSLQNKQKIFN